MIKNLWNNRQPTLLAIHVFFSAAREKLKVADEKKLLDFKMTCYRRIMKVYWKDKISNVSIKEQVADCFVLGAVRLMVPNGIRIRSAVFPQCTGHTDRPTDRATHRPTDRSSTEKFDDCRPVRL